MSGGRGKQRGAQGASTTVKNRSQVTRHKKNGQVIKTWFNRNAFEKRERIVF